MKKNIIVSVIILIVITIMVWAIVYFFNRETIKLELLIPEEDEDDFMDVFTEEKNDQENLWIFSTHEIEFNQELYDHLHYELEIDVKNKLILTKEENSWGGQVVFDYLGEKTILRDSMSIYGPGGFSCKVHKTNFDKIIILECLPYAINEKIYIDINKKEIVATITHNYWYNNFNVEKDGENIAEIIFDVDPCEDKSLGEKVELRGVLFNGNPISFFKEPFFLTCDYHVFDTLVHRPFFSIKDIIIDYNFSKLKTEIEVRDIRDDGEEIIYWNKIIIFDLEK